MDKLAAFYFIRVPPASEYHVVQVIALLVCPSVLLSVNIVRLSAITRVLLIQYLLDFLHMYIQSEQMKNRVKFRVVKYQGQKIRVAILDVWIL